MAVLGGVALVANWVLLFEAYSHASIAVATVTYHIARFASQSVPLLRPCEWAVYQSGPRRDSGWIKSLPVCA